MRLPNKDVSGCCFIREETTLVNSFESARERTRTYDLISSDLILAAQDRQDAANCLQFLPLPCLDFSHDLLPSASHCHAVPASASVLMFLELATQHGIAWHSMATLCYHMLQPVVGKHIGQNTMQNLQRTHV